MALTMASGGKTVLHLHIGAPKTGSSAIQAFLSLNRAAFQYATCIHYPESASDVRALKGKPTAGNGAQIARHLRSRKRESFDKAIRMLNRELSPGHAQVLISSEALWGLAEERLSEFAAVLRERLTVKIICYVRPQVKHIESAYLQVLGNRGYKGDIADFFVQQSSKFHSGSRVRFLLDLFGRENVTIRKYDRSELVGGDVIDDFLSIFGLAWDPQYIRPPEVNSSLDPEHYVYARVVGEAAGGQGVGKKAMRDLRSMPLLGTLYDEAAAMRDVQVMDVGTAQRIAEHYAVDNELLDTLVPGFEPNFNADNSRAVKALQVGSDQRPSGFTRLELLLLHQLAQLEARVDALTGSSAESTDDEE